MRKAFTLIELLVVVTIIVVLISLMVPSMEGAVKQAQMASCASNLRVIGTATRMYTSDYATMLPWVGYGGGNAFIYYVIYRSAQESPQGQPTGFQNLGLLGGPRAQYLSLQSAAWFCPLQTCDSGAMYSKGDPSFWSAVPNHLDGSTLLPEDAHLGWMSRRTGYLRRRVAGQTDFDAIKATEFGAGVFLADLFSDPPVHVGKSHRDSVNAWFMDGGVVRRNFPLNKAPYDYWSTPGVPTYTPQSRLQLIWDALDRGAP